MYGTEKDGNTTPWFTIIFVKFIGRNEDVLNVVQYLTMRSKFVFSLCLK